MTSTIPGIEEEQARRNHRRNKNASDMSSEQPYNFKLEKFDSFMIDSESEGVGNTLNSTTLQQVMKQGDKAN